jgi:hypothetical protein
MRALFREDCVLSRPCILALLMSAPATVLAQSIAAPSIKAGDTWVYRTTTEKGPSGWNQSHDQTVVARVTPSSMYYTVQATGSTQPAKELFSQLDWSRVRDLDGEETVQHPNQTFKSEEWLSKYTVVGFESVEVPAATFNALKIEAEGHWTAELEPTQTVVQGAQSNSDGTSMVTQTQKTTDTTVSGRTYRAFWYVPEVRRWVKSVEEYYGSGGVRNARFTGELESSKLE